MIQTNYNPDVLSCLANLSNDEVFTPPKLVNEMLDLLPVELWSNPNATFLDPVCKSGVFLREMAKRLMSGLEKHIPDQQKRINHIFTKQLFGIAISELTSLLSRRSVYCSKIANGKYSVCDTFNDVQGNIRYVKMKHIWQNGQCVYCGASQKEYERDSTLNAYAYGFIHSDEKYTLFNMKFDVIIGNPPYQMSDGGGTGSSAKPIYNLFINQAKEISPRYLLMIIPARWYSGGKGLDSFREEMLKDKRISALVDFADSRDCFPGVDIAGGICYFLWEREYNGICEVTTFQKSGKTKSKRYLGDFEIFIRDNISIDIIKKVKERSSSFLDEIVSSRMPFGLTSNVKPSDSGDLILISSSGRGKISSEKITTGQELIKKWKVLLSKASNDHGGQPDKEGKRKIFSRIEVMSPNTVCTESYLVVGNYNTKEEAENMVCFLKTIFCRFLVSTILLTQNITKGKFIFVPSLPMNIKWDDETLFKKFELSDEEISFISQQIRSMD